MPSRRIADAGPLVPAPGHRGSGRRQSVGFVRGRAFVAALLAALGLSAQAPVLTLACEDKTDYPNVLGSGTEIDARHPGACIEFVTQLGNSLGLKVTLRRLPWRRALELELRNGTIDGLFPVSYRKDREPFGVWPQKDGKADDTRSMFASSYFFYKLKASPLQWDGKVLANLRGSIGASRGYSIVEDLKQMGCDVQESDDMQKDLKRLAQGRLEAIAGLEAAQDFLLENSPELGKDIVKLQPPISTKAYFLVLSHAFVARNPDLAQRIWDKCRELREKELPKILKKYPGQ